MTVFEKPLKSDMPRYLVPQLGTIYEKLGDLSWLLVRGIYGYFFIPHGCQKLFGWFGGAGLAGVAQGFAHEGLQPAYFWAGYIGSLELFGGILMLVGFLTRPVAALFAGFMFVAAVHVTVPHGYFWTKGGMEVPILLTFLALAILLRGGGRYSIDRLLGKEI